MQDKTIQPPRHSARVAGQQKRRAHPVDEKQREKKVCKEVSIETGEKLLNVGQFKEAQEHFEIAAQQGMFKAQFYLATGYWYGFILTPQGTQIDFLQVNKKLSEKYLLAAVTNPMKSVQDVTLVKQLFNLLNTVRDCRDLVKGYKDYLEFHANQGDYKAKAALGLYYMEHGKRFGDLLTRKNREQFITCIDLLANEFSALAALGLGALHESGASDEQGFFLKKDPGLAIGYYQSAIASVPWNLDENEKKILGQSFFRLGRLIKNKDHLISAIGYGCQEAEYELGVYYAENVQEFIPEMIPFLLVAADKNFQPAQEKLDSNRYEVGVYLARRAQNAPITRKMILYLLEAGSKGYKDVQEKLDANPSILGIHYAETVTYPTKEMLLYIKKAAEKGEPIARKKLVDLFLAGQLDLDAFCLKIIKNSNSKEALLQLGEFYRRGEKKWQIGQDLAEAAILYLKALNFNEAALWNQFKDDAAMCYVLGKHFAEGRILKQAPHFAFKYLNHAAEKGHVEASFIIAGAHLGEHQAADFCVLFPIAQNEGWLSQDKGRSLEKGLEYYTYCREQGHQGTKDKFAHPEFLYLLAFELQNGSSYCTKNLLKAAEYYILILATQKKAFLEQLVIDNLNKIYEECKGSNSEVNRYLIEKNSTLKFLKKNSLPSCYFFPGNPVASYLNRPSTAVNYKAFICPLTGEVMTDPVILSVDDINYERFAIEEWLKNNEFSPVTQKKVPASGFFLIPNVNLKSLIEAQQIKPYISLS